MNKFKEVEDVFYTLCGKCYNIWPTADGYDIIQCPDCEGHEFFTGIRLDKIKDVTYAVMSRNFKIENKHLVKGSTLEEFDSDIKKFDKEHNK